MRPIESGITTGWKTGTITTGEEEEGEGEEEEGDEAGAEEGKKTGNLELEDKPLEDHQKKEDMVKGMWGQWKTKLKKPGKEM